jgi:hypothetical protein
MEQNPYQSPKTPGEQSKPASKSSGSWLWVFLGCFLTLGAFQSLKSGNLPVNYDERLGYLTATIGLPISCFVIGFFLRWRAAARNRQQQDR